MTSLRQRLCVVLSAVFLLVPGSLRAQSGKAAAHARLGREQTLPLVFEGNQGQFPGDVAFVGRTQRYSVAIGPEDLRFSLPGAHGPSSVVLSLAGSEGGTPAGITEASFRTNYFLGNDPAKYRTGVRNYTRVGLGHVYPGIDAQFYAAGNSIEHDFLVAPGADAARIAMRIATQGTGATLSPEGDVVIAGGEGELRLRKPVAYQQDAAGKRTAVAAAFTLTGDAGAREVHFQLGSYDHARRLVIDPVITYGSFFDGVNGSTASAVVADSLGDLYLTGYTTTPSTGFGGLTAMVDVNAAPVPSSPPANDVFVVKFNATGSATPVAWLSYFGSNVGDSRSTSIALQPTSGVTLAVGGNTAATNFPTTPGSVTPKVSGADTTGFVVTLFASTGMIVSSTYLDSAPGSSSDTTSVGALAMDALGGVYAVGAATGGGLPVTKDNLPVDAAVLSDGHSKGFLFELTPTLGMGPLVTYVSGNGTSADTFLTGVAVDAADNVYVGGYTNGPFPMAGTYSDGNMNTPNPTGVKGYDAFAAKIVPGTVVASIPPLPPVVTASGIGYSTWISGTGDDQVNSLAMDASGDLFVFGQTASADLLASKVTTYSYAAVVPPLLPVVTGGINSSANPVTKTLPSTATPTPTSGFVAKLDATGQPLVLTYLGGAGTDILTSGAAFGTSAVYAGGQSTSNLPAAYTSAALLPAGQDVTTPAAQHGVLLELDSNLVGVTYIANVGGSAGPDSVVGVGLDTAGDAYVGSNIMSATAYTTTGAFETTRAATAAGANSAYFAEISTASGSPLPVLLTAVTCPSATTQPNQPVGCPDPIGLPNASGTAAPQENVTYTFSLAPPPGATQNLVPLAGVTLQIPTQANLSFDTVTLTDTTSGAAAANLSADCGISGTGVSCTILAYPKTNTGYFDSLTLVLSTHVTSQPPVTNPGATPPVGPIGVTATVAAPTFPSQSATENSNVVLPAQLSMTAAVKSPSPATVFTTNSGATSPNTQVTYTFTIANAAAGGSATNAVFTLNPGTAPGAFVASAISTSPSTGTCSLAGCTGLGIAAGTSVVVTVVGTYPDAALGGAASATAPSVGATATSFLSTAVTTAPAVTVQRGVHLQVVGTFSDPSLNASGYISLGDVVSYSVLVTNQGPSASSGADTLAVTIAAPTSAQAVQATFTPAAGSPFNCSAASTKVTCTVTLSAIASGSTNTTQPLLLSGTFNDDATNTAVVGSMIPVNFAAAATLVSDTDSGGSGSSTSNSPEAVVRYAALVFPGSGPITTTAPTCAGGSPCVYLQNTSNTGYANYTFQVTNNGPDASEGTALTITLPSAPRDASNVYHALLSTTPVPAVTKGAANVGTAPTCSYTASSNTATPLITCSGGNVPVGATLTVTGSLYADASAIPTSAEDDTAAAGTGGKVVVAQSALGTPASLPVGSLEVDRAAHLVTGKGLAATGTSPSTASPPLINLAESSTSVNDTVTVTLSVGTTALNTLPSATLTDTLPSYFLFTKAPAVTGATSATCTLGGAGIVSGSTTTGGTPASNQLSCALGSLAPGTTGSTPVTQVTITYSGKFIDAGTGADITGATAAAKVKQLLVTLPAATAVTTLAVDPFTSQATSSTVAVNVERLVHMVVRKTRNAAVAAAPSTFADTTDPNLDEKTTATKFGVNDEIEYDLAVANAGVNKALGVQFSDTLPPYFTLVTTFLAAGNSAPDAGANSAPAGQLAAGSLACYLGSSTGGTPLTLPFPNGASSQVITCTYGTASAPLALTSAETLGSASAIQLVYQGKYQDNAPGADNIGVGVSTALITSTAGEASATTPLGVDSGPPSDGLSTALAPYSLQRAAHLKLLGAPLQTTTSETPLTTAGATSIIAEAEPSTTAGATPVYNCLRYKVYVQNSGPNIARQPQLTATLPSGLVLTSSPTGATTTPGSDAPLPSTCTYGASASPTVPVATLAPLSEVANNSVVVDLDGYFGLNTLAGVNSQAGFTLSYTKLTDPGVMESLKASSFTTVSGAALTVVNTPSGSNFAVSPYATSPYTKTLLQPVALTLGSVGAPGITTLTMATALPGGAILPTGKSPDPRYGTIPLYQSGKPSPLFYSLSTTALPTAGTNPTGVCVSSGVSGTALPDGFAKPERVLLWDLANLPAGTALGAVPNVSSPYTGDITSSVVALGGVNYVEAGGPLDPYNAKNLTLPAVQAQPQLVCGQMNGFATSAAPAVLAVLEPVNFAPLITPNPSTVSQTPGKGVSEVSYLFPTSFDYNNNDPCYVASTAGGAAARSSCDDNLVLTTWVFGGEALVPSLSHTIGPMTPDVAANFVATTYEVQAGETLYDLVNDQLAEITYQAAKFCDPGIASSSYHPVTSPAPCPVSTALAGTPPQALDFGSGDIAQLVPSLNGGSSALIVLPPAATPTASNTAVASGYTAAAGTVTAGQTVGFLWRLTDISNSSLTYNLNCFEVDAATQSVAIPFTPGLSCEVPANIGFSNPAIYVVTQGTLNAQNHTPGWRSMGGALLATLLAPFALFRRRFSQGRRMVLMALLLLGGAVSLSGCGSASSGSTAVASGTYYFRLSATPVGGGATLYSTAFSVTVVGGD